MILLNLSNNPWIQFNCDTQNFPLQKQPSEMFWNTYIEEHLETVGSTSDLLLKIYILFV